jgi:hypothetical protein
VYNVCFKTCKAQYDLHTLLRPLFNKIYTVSNNSMQWQWHIQISEPEKEQKRTHEMKQRPNPERIKGQIFQSIRSYVFVAWFPDLSVAVRIYSLAYLYYLKANRNLFSKYFEVYMILKDDCTKRRLLAIEVWSAEVETCNMRLFHPHLKLSIFYVSRDQPRPGSFLKKREVPGKEVGSWGQCEKLPDWLGY